MPTPSDLESNPLSEEDVLEQIQELHDEFIKMLCSCGWNAAAVTVGTMTWILIYYLYGYTDTLGILGYILLSFMEGVFSNLVPMPLMVKATREENESLCVATKKSFRTALKFMLHDSLYQFLYDAIVFLGKNKSFHGKFIRNETATFSPIEILFALLIYGVGYSALYHAENKLIGDKVLLSESAKVGLQYWVFYINDSYCDIGDTLNLLNFGNAVGTTAVMGACDFLANAIPAVVTYQKKKSQLEDQLDNPQSKNCFKKFFSGLCLWRKPDVLIATSNGAQRVNSSYLSLNG